MKLYFAGNAGHGKAGKEREEILLRLKTRRMFSFYWCHKAFKKHFITWIKRNQK